MVSNQVSFRNIAIAAHPNLPEALIEAERIADFLIANGIHATFGSIYDAQLLEGIKEQEFDLWIALGGDGSMLRSGHVCASHSVPILGINMGSLGFLLEIQRRDWRNSLQKVLSGDYWLEARMMLYAEQRRDDLCLGSWDVVNEAMVGRGEIMRPVHLATYVDSRYLTTYVADGLIASTPTGSTAYALAAGGPILPPELRNILIVPVAPHLSVDRAIVLAEGSSVNIQVQTDHKAALSVDGQTPVSLHDGDQVKIRANKHSVHFVRLQDPGYFYRNITSRMNQNIKTGENR